MTGQAGALPQEPIGEGKYARIERERRFLLGGPPSPAAVTGRRRITDRYLPGTRLRLRRIDYLHSGDSQFKFTQKVPANRPGYVQGLITKAELLGDTDSRFATLGIGLADGWLIAEFDWLGRVKSEPLGVAVNDAVRPSREPLKYKERCGN